MSPVVRISLCGLLAVIMTGGCRIVTRVSPELTPDGPPHTARAGSARLPETGQSQKPPTPAPRPKDLTSAKASAAESQTSTEKPTTKPASAETANNTEKTGDDAEIARLLADVRESGKLPADELAQLGRDLREVPPVQRQFMLRMLKLSLAPEEESAPTPRVTAAEQARQAARARLARRDADYAANLAPIRPPRQRAEDRDPPSLRHDRYPPRQEVEPVSYNAPYPSSDSPRPADNPLRHVAGASETTRYEQLAKIAAHGDLATAKARPPRAATVHQQYAQAVALDTEAAYQAVWEYFPPQPGDTDRQHYADLAHQHLERLANRQPVAKESVDPTAWRTALTDAIKQLEKAAEQPSDDPQQHARQAASLRLLYLVAEQKEQALRPIDKLSADEQEYWSHQLHALATYMDRDGMPVESRRATLALRELRDAVGNLAAAGNLDVKNLAFCTDIFSFGRIAEFQKYEFTPGQELALYVEIDNFTSRQAPAGYETELRGSYEIVNPNGGLVAEHTFQVQKETCRNRRRDYFLGYLMRLPKTIYPGKYVLQLTIEDTLGHKFGQSSIDFTIRQ